MSTLRRLLLRLYNVIRPGAADAELDRELRAHLTLLEDEYVRRGLTSAAAHLAARRALGGVAQAKDSHREARGIRWLADLRADVLYAIRTLRRMPGFTVVVVVTLALGIGANTSIFTLIDALLFKPAAWNTTGRLVWILLVRGDSRGPWSMSYPDYLAYRDSAKTLTGVLASAGNGVSVGGAHPDLANGGLVSGNYFDVLGIRASLGRTFTPAEDGAPGAHPVVVLADAFWRSHFGADPRVVNQVVAINGRPFTIVGVAPSGFTGINAADNAEQLWVPLAMQSVVMRWDPHLLQAANDRWLSVVGRLRPDASVEQADAEMRVIARQLVPPAAPADRQRTARIAPVRGGLDSWEQTQLAPKLRLIAIVPVLVLLVACANVANVLMARYVSRRREFAMRRAIGASRGRLVRQLLTESLVVAILSAGAGFGTAHGLTALMVHFGDLPADVAALLTPDHRALIASTIVAMVSAVFFALLPAFTATRFDLLPALKDEGTTSTWGRGAARWRGCLVVAQVALSLTLIIVAGLFVQSLSNAMRVNPGFDPHGVVTASFDPDLQGYTTSRRDRFVAELLTRISSVPGVTSAAVTRFLPLSQDMYGATIIGEQGAGPVEAAAENISPRYFETLRMPFVAGRDFSGADAAEGSEVTIVNETLAQRLWPGLNPLGRRFRVSDPLGPWREVVGVVGDSKYFETTESPLAIYYSPHLSTPVTLLVRTASDPRAAFVALTAIVRDLDPDLPLSRVQTLDDSIRRGFLGQRAVTLLLSAFGCLTLVLAAVGIYGVAAHNASRRTREVGIRVALGARAADVRNLFVRESLGVSAVGVAIGLVGSAAGSRLLASFLYGLAPTDMLTFAGGALALCGVTVMSSYGPARRAARADPILVLKGE